MKLMKTCLFFFFCLSIAPLVFGEPGLVELYYDPEGGDPLGCPCTSTITNPYQDGVAICVYWDNNMTGPDPTDISPAIGNGYGQVNWNCNSLNGLATGLGNGYFYFETYLIVGNLPEQTSGDNPVYYLEISSMGSDSCCWTSDTFRILPGVQTRSFTWANWHCARGRCVRVIEPPSPPTNFNANRDTRCLSVEATWDHDGVNLAGFNVFQVNEQGGADFFMATVDAASRYAAFTSTSNVPRRYYVKAFNAGGESSPSNIDTGSTYQLRYAQGAAGNIEGRNLANTQFSIQVERPTADCFSHWELWLLVNGERRSPPLSMDSIISGPILITLTDVFPNDTTLNFCRLLLVDTSMVAAGIMFTDTTDSTFHLGSGIISAVDIPGSLMPDRFGLAQNYPNPFNPETEIVFNVPITSAVRIQVYNIMGQLVRTLADTRYTAGLHSVRWDGRSDAGTAVSAGIYLYRMDAQNFTQTKKMLLMK